MSQTFSTKVSEQMSARDQACVRCGGRATDRHHRRRKRVNGDGLAHTTANGIRMCGMGNVLGCHGWAHKHPVEARAKGYIVLPEEDPREVPMWHYSRGWVLLDEDGGWKAVDVRSSLSPQRTEEPR